MIAEIVQFTFDRFNVLFHLTQLLIDFERLFDSLRFLEEIANAIRRRLKIAKL